MSPPIKRLKLFQTLAEGFEIEIDPQTYANPYCGGITDSGMFSAYNLYQLIDNIPVIGSHYATTIYSFSQTYQNIVRFATPQNNMSYAAFAEARKKLEIEQNARLSRDGKNFYLMKTTPYNFWNYDGVTVKICLSPSECNEDTCISLGIREDTTLVFEDALIVKLDRAWFCPEIFLSSRWGVEDYGVAEISDGTASVTNRGILPLIPTHMVLSRVIGQRHFANPHLVGVISDVVPRAPILGVGVLPPLARPAHPPQGRGLAAPAAQGAPSGQGGAENGAAESKRVELLVKQWPR